MAGDEGKAHWIDPECDVLLDGLIAKKSTHQSGNGFKPTVWAKIVKDVHAANPDARKKKDQMKCISKLNCLQKGFEKTVAPEGTAKLKVFGFAFSQQEILDLKIADLGLALDGSGV
ncbi:hypothetical protein B0H13DRAFT_1857365 [Mycena leptocephala]|nr:hypothetical protein B0H13DRAFT_1857365 [Mycena leptocephala]